MIVAQSQDQSLKEIQHSEKTERFGMKYSVENKNPATDTFLSKVHGLRLPQGPLQKGKVRSASAAKLRPSKAATKQLRELARQPAFKQYSVEKVDVSGYEGRGFDREALRELIRGLRNLIAIREVVLRGNGIGDDCCEEVAELLRNPDIKCLDLSSNGLGKHSALAMSQALAETSHLVWLEYFLLQGRSVSRNVFAKDFVSTKGILAGLKSHTALFHLGISLDERSSELLCPTLFAKGGGEKSINSLNLRDSKFTLKAFTSLTQLLARPRSKAELYHITGSSFKMVALSFKHCYLTQEMVEKLASVVRLNRTLVKLDLSSNGFQCREGEAVINALKVKGR